MMVMNTSSETLRQKLHAHKSVWWKQFLNRAYLYTEGFHTSTMVLTTAYESSSKASDAIFWPPWAPACMWNPNS
ncbi:hypothetical protein STEG23_030100, partial [Scotinomys teguina]